MLSARSSGKRSVWIDSYGTLSAASVSIFTCTRRCRAMALVPYWRTRARAPSESSMDRSSKVAVWGSPSMKNNDVQTMCVDKASGLRGWRARPGSAATWGGWAGYVMQSKPQFLGAPGLLIPTQTSLWLVFERGRQAQTCRPCPDRRPRASLPAQLDCSDLGPHTPDQGFVRPHVLSAASKTQSSVFRRLILC